MDHSGRRGGNRIASEIEQRFRGIEERVTRLEDRSVTAAYERQQIEQKMEERCIMMSERILFSTKTERDKNKKRKRNMRMEAAYNSQMRRMERTWPLARDVSDKEVGVSLSDIEEEPGIYNGDRRGGRGHSKSMNALDREMNLG
jgi:hypothetical protein